MSLPPHYVGRNRHGQYCVPQSSAHRPVAQAILAGKVWERRTIECIEQHAGDGDVVHAGAYFGDFLPAVTKALAPGATLWAFEPNPENYQCAAETVRMNGLTNCRLFNAALGDEETSTVLVTEMANGYVLGGASYLESLTLPKYTGESAVVEMLTIDKLVGDRRVTVIHLDVEGAELLGLLGAQVCIRRDRPILLLESMVLPTSLRDVPYDVIEHWSGSWLLKPS
jgi:FkbM family methyltransferase